MIKLRKLNDIEFILNCDMIETVLENPDTTIRLTDGNTYIVKESIDEVVSKTIEFKRKIYSNVISELLK